MSRFPAYGPSVVSFMDMPLVEGTEEYPWAPRVAAYQWPWPSLVGFARWEDEQFIPFDGLVISAPMGETTTAMTEAHPWVIDRRQKFSFKFYGHQYKVLSVGEDQMLRGRNLLCVENPDHSWEMLQFAEAELIGPQEYEVSVLLRGQNGTEQAALPRAAGARVVLYDPSSIEPLNLPQDLAQLPLKLRYGPGEHSPTYHTWQEEDRQFKAIGLRPYSPVQLQLRRKGEQLLFSWKRRTRFGGDAWEPPDVPLNEDAEQYQAEAEFSSGYRIRSELLFEPKWDIWGQLNPVKLTVWQRSPTYGLGEPATENFI